MSNKGPLPGKLRRKRSEHKSKQNKENTKRMSSEDDDSSSGDELEAPSEFLNVRNSKSPMIQLNSPDIRKKVEAYISKRALSPDADEEQTLQWLKAHGYDEKKFEGFTAEDLMDTPVEDLTDVVGPLKAQQLYNELHKKQQPPGLPEILPPNGSARPKLPGMPPRKPPSRPPNKPPSRPPPARDPPKIAHENKKKIDFIRQRQSSSPGARDKQKKTFEPNFGRMKTSPLPKKHRKISYHEKYKLRIFLPSADTCVETVSMDFTFSKLKDIVWEHQSLKTKKKKFVFRLWSGDMSTFMQDEQNMIDFFESLPDGTSDNSDLSTGDFDLYLVKPGDTSGVSSKGKKGWSKANLQNPSLGTKKVREPGTPRVTLLSHNPKATNRHSKPPSTPSRVMRAFTASPFPKKKKITVVAKPTGRKVTQFISPPERWEESTFCEKCHKSGKLHNCRICGKMFCGKCTGKMEVPDVFKKKNKPGAVRCCLGCIAKVESGAELVEDNIAPPTASPEKLSTEDDFIPPPPAPPEEEEEEEEKAPVIKSWLKVYWQRGKMKKNGYSNNNSNTSIDELEKDPDFICQIEVESTTTLETIHTTVMKMVGNTKLAGWVKDAYVYMFKDTIIHSVHYFAFEARHLLPQLFVKNNSRVNLDVGQQMKQKRLVRAGSKTMDTEREKALSENKQAEKKSTGYTPMTNEQKKKWFKNWEVGDREFSPPKLEFKSNSTREEKKGTTNFIPFYSVKATFQAPAKEGLPPGAEEEDYQVKKVSKHQNKKSLKGRSKDLATRSQTLFGATPSDRNEDHDLMSTITADCYSLPPPPGF